MSKPWRENKDILDGAYDMLPGPSWGTIIIDDVVETVDDLTYWVSNNRKHIGIIDGSFNVDIRPIKDNWFGDGFPEELREKWGIYAVTRW